MNGARTLVDNLSDAPMWTLALHDARGNSFNVDSFSDLNRLMRPASATSMSSLTTARDLPSGGAMTLAEGS